MDVKRIIRIDAGSSNPLSLLLGMEGSILLVSNFFLWRTTFVGLNLFQSGHTNSCPFSSILAKFNINGGYC